MQQFLTVFTNRVEFGTILESLLNYGEGGVEHPNPPPSVRHWLARESFQKETRELSIDYNIEIEVLDWLRSKNRLSYW